MAIQDHIGQLNVDPLDEYNQIVDSAERADAQTQKIQDEDEKEEKKEIEIKTKEKEEEDSRHLGDKILDTPVLGQVASVGAGTLDTAFDVIGLVPWLKDKDEWWDEHHGRDREDNPVNKFIRDAAGIIVPSLTGGGLVAKGAQGLAKVGKLGKGIQAASKLRRTQVLGRIAVEMGIGTGVEAVSEVTEDPGNLSTALSDWLGTEIPWATRDGMSPDLIKKRNLYESALLGGATGLLDAFMSLQHLPKFTPKGPKGKKLIDEQNLKKAKQLEDADGDPLVAEVTAKAAAREEAITDKAVRDFEKGDGEYSPYANEPHVASDRPPGAYDPDPAGAKVSYARIADNIGTTDGQARPVVTDYYRDEILKADSSEARSKLIKKISDEASPEYEVRVKTATGSKTITPQMQEKALKELTIAATKSDPDEFKKLAEGFLEFTNDRIMVGGKSVKLLTTAGAKNATAILMRGLDIISPDNLKSGAMVMNQAVDEVTNMSTMVDTFGQTINTASQQEIIIDNLAYLMREVGVHKAIKGHGLNAVKFLDEAKRADELDINWWKNETDSFNEAVENHTRQASELAAELKYVAKNDPEYLKPLYREMARSGGDVDTIHALNKVMENRISFWKKAFYDGNSDIPSHLIKELQSARYNSVLTGLAPVRALAGAATAIVGKPVTVFVGAGLTGNIGAWKRATYVYGGVMENFNRGLKNLQTEWKYALDNPRASADMGQGGRKDLQANVLEDRQTIEEMSAIWYEEGQFGKVAVWNMTKVLAAFNDHFIPRFGINAMRAIDGFTKSFTASMAARGKAYDTLFEASKGVFEEADFNKMQRAIYNDMFNADGGPKTLKAFEAKQAADFASGEMNLNLDSEIVSSLETVMKNFPVLKAIFMFPRTGANAIELAATFSPGNAITAITNGKLNLSLGKARRVFQADSPDAIKNVLAEHGLAGMDEEAAFNALKSEYIGRHTMGSAVVMGAALMAANGMLTGSGPQDGAERKRMMAMGYKPFSVTDPETGISFSYQGIEPFDTFLGLTADVVQKFTRADEAVTEDWFRAIVHSITMNVSNKTFLSGLEPLAGLVRGDPGELQKFLSNEMNNLTPGAGIRSILSKAITPQLKDVEKNFLGYYANKNKWFVADDLENYVDVYTGEPINTYDPFTRAWNSVAPFFKVNPKMEPWRQQLLASGWDGLQQVQVERKSGIKLNAKQRQFVNNYMGTNFGLGKQVEKIFNQGPEYWKRETQRFKKARGLKTNDDMPIRKTLLHQLLDQVHSDARSAAMDALAMEDSKFAASRELKAYRDSELSRGNYNKASDVADEITKLREIPK